MDVTYDILPDDVYLDKVNNGSTYTVLLREELGATGAAMMAAACIGAHESVATCADRWLAPSLGPATAPDSTPPEVYRRLYPIYRTIRATTPPASSALCGARRKGA